MIAIIPARGGSKGLPGKNIKEMCDKPLIAYTIEAALKSKSIDHVILSTDDEEIAAVAKKYGAEVPFMRPAELASDTAMAVDNYIYTIGRLEKEWNTKIDSFVVLQPTSPLRIAEDIDGAVELFNARNADSVVTYVKEAHPIFWHKKIDENNKLEDIFEGTIANRQELPITYYPNGAVYVFSTEMIRQKKYYTDKSYAYKYERAKDAFNAVLGNEPEPFELDVNLEGNELSVKTVKGKVFGPQPYLAVKTKSGRYIHDEFDFGLDGKSWYYVFSENMIRYEDIDTIGIASNDQYGQTYIKTIKINS